MNSFNVSFVCRPSKVSKRTGLAPVEMSISINSQRVFIQLPRKEVPTQFAKSINSKKVCDLKEFLHIMYAKVQQCQTEMMALGIPVTAMSLKDFFINGAKVYTVEDLFKDYLKILENRIGENFSLRVYERYVLVRDLFFTVMDKNKPCTEISNMYVLEYQNLCNKRYKETTASGYLSRLKTFIKFGLDNGKIKANPFAGVKIRKVDANKPFLTDEELALIENKNFGIERINKVKDMFLFMCYTGLSYSDMAKLTKDDIQETDEGVRYIKDNRIKTNVGYTILLTKKAIAILEKYDYQLPVISNVRMNAYLKEVQDICGISKNLTCHVARHTCACQLLNAGVSLDVVAKVLGHNSTRSTLIYAKMLDSTVLKDMQVMDN